MNYSYENLIKSHSQGKFCFIGHLFIGGGSVYWWLEVGSC